MAADPVILDTNVLIYANTVGSSFRAAAQQAISGHAQAGDTLWISRQIMREYPAALSRPQGILIPVPLPKLIADVQRFQTEYTVAEDGPSVTDELLRIIAPTSIGGKRIHDANIVATMLTHGIGTLLTNNPHNFGIFSNLINIEPL